MCVCVCVCVCVSTDSLVLGVEVVVLITSLSISPMMSSPSSENSPPNTAPFSTPVYINILCLYFQHSHEFMSESESFELVRNLVATLDRMWGFAVNSLTQTHTHTHTHIPHRYVRTHRHTHTLEHLVTLTIEV